VFVRGVWSDTAGDNRRQQNRLYEHFIH